MLTVGIHLCYVQEMAGVHRVTSLSGQEDESG